MRKLGDLAFMSMFALQSSQACYFRIAQCKALHLRAPKQCMCLISLTKYEGVRSLNQLIALAPTGVFTAMNCEFLLVLCLGCRCRGIFHDSDFLRLVFIMLNSSKEIDTISMMFIPYH